MKKRSADFTGGIMDTGFVVEIFQVKADINRWKRGDIS